MLAGCMLFGAAQTARASGPIERMLQYIPHPTDPNVVVLRVGAGSEALLFSRDAGRSFHALCTSAISPSFDRFALSDAPNLVPALIDARGRIVVASTEGLWSGDATGCQWTQPDAFAGRWVTGLALDPADPAQVLAIANTSIGEGDAQEVRAELLRRDADGQWTLQGALVPTTPGVRAYGGELLAATSPSGTLLYATVMIVSSSAAVQGVSAIVVSSDGGKTWTRRAPLPAGYPGLHLVAVSPTDPKRLIASSRTRNETQLIVSDDGGLSFRPYLTVLALSGVSFAPSGRVFIGDAGDPGSLERTGGIYTAAALGDAPALVPQPPQVNPAVDCVGYDGSADALRVCRFHRYGTMNTSSGTFAQLSQIEAVKGLLPCEGRDITAACEAQFNDGPAWCCTGHFPFTSFCGSYDVTRTSSGRRVDCGMAGRAADIAAGRR